MSGGRSAAGAGAVSQDAMGGFASSFLGQAGLQMAAGAAGATAQVPTRGQAFLVDYADRAAPPAILTGTPLPKMGGATVNVNVDTQQVLRRLPRTLYGNNAAVWDGSLLIGSEMVDRLRTAGVSILRFPGGSSADCYHWDGKYPPYAKTMGWHSLSGAWSVDTASYMRLVRELGAIPMLTVNHGYTSYDSTSSDGNVENAARLAEDWVEYCNSPNDGNNPNGGTDWAARRAADGFPTPFGVHYWEVGNESYGSWETGYDPTGETYAANFNVIVDRMKAVDATIQVGLNAQLDKRMQPWTANVLSHPGTADRADFLSVHHYFGWLPNAAAIDYEGTLTKSVEVAQKRTWLDELVAQNTQRTPDDLPYFFGEYNLPIPTNPMHVALVSGLFIAKIIGEIATTGWAAAAYWDVLNGWETTPGVGTGDLGFLSRGQADVPNLTPRPSYYPFFFYTRNFGDRLVTATSSESTLVVYASTFGSGEVGLVLINEAKVPKSARISFEGFTPGAEANVWILAGDSLEAQAVTVNGIPSGSIAGGPTLDLVVPYRTTPKAGELVVDVPALSVTSVVAY